MKRNRSSDTAESAAATRALESLRPSAERVIHDPWAIRFLGPKNRFLVELTRLSSLRRLVTTTAHAQDVKSIVEALKSSGRSALT